MTLEATIKNAFPTPFIKPRSQACISVLMNVAAVNTVIHNNKPRPVTIFGLILSVQYPTHNEQAAREIPLGMKEATSQDSANPCSFRIEIRLKIKPVPKAALLQRAKADIMQKGVLTAVFLVHISRSGSDLMLLASSFDFLVSKIISSSNSSPEIAGMALLRPSGS